MNFEKDGRHSWLYLSVTLVVMLTILSFHDSNGILVAILIEKFNETNAKAGWVVSIVIFLTCLFSPVVINIYHSLGFRWCMAIAGCFYIFAFLTTGFVPSLNYMFLTYSIPFGITMSFLGQLSIRTQKDYFEKHYGKAMGVRFGGVALGTMVMSYILPIIYDQLAFKGTLLALLGFSPLFVIFALVSRTSPDRAIKQSTGQGFLSKKIKIYKELLQDNSFVLCLAGTSLFFTTCFAHMIFMVQYAVTLGYPLSKAKWLVILRNITTLPSRLIVGHFVDIAFRNGKVKFLIQLTYPTFGLLSFMCIFFKTFPLLMLYMGLCGVVEAVFWVSISQYVDEITGRYHSDDAFSLSFFISAFTGLIGPPTLGWLFDVTGDFRYVFLAICLVSLLAGILVILSSFVNVPPELSLKEKGRNRKSVSDTLELSGSDEGFVACTAYETSV